MQATVVAVAFGFAVVCGFNDGGAMLASGLRVRGLAPWGAILAAAVGVAGVPLLLGTAVAATLADRLVTFDGPVGLRALLVAVGVATGTSALLARRGLPTSLTLALVGSLTGAGAGAGFTVSWSTVLVVLVVAFVAPLVGMLAGWVLTAVVSASSRWDVSLSSWILPMHLAGFGLQGVAYGANDGQKMLAVAAVAMGTADPGGLSVPVLTGLAAAFGVGAVAGLPRVARSLGGGVVPLEPADAVVTEASSAAVVLATSAIGAPVSMTQAISGAMVGTRMVRGRGRIRWDEVARLVVAWAITLPVSLGAAGVGGFVAARL